MFLGAPMSACKDNGNGSGTQETTDQKIVVSATDKKTKLILGETVQLISSIEGVTWESDHPEVATVNASGLVESKAVGSAKITAKKDGYKDGSITIKVDLEKIEITTAGGAKTVVKGETLQVNANKDNVTWETSDATIATVSNAGLVTAIKPGKVTLVKSKYNERVEECSKALEILKKYFEIDNLCQLYEYQLPECEKLLNDPILFKRVKHVVTENERVQQFSAAMTAGKTEEMGRLLCESHKSLRDDYEVTGEYLDTIVEAAMNAYAIGARMTGGGFGGCAIALIENRFFEDFRIRVDKEYLRNAISLYSYLKFPQSNSNALFFLPKAIAA